MLAMRLLIIAAVAATLVSCTDRWTQLPSIPDKEGFAGPFVGTSNGALLIAGGANFPDKKPWEGGKKVWYDTVFVLEPAGKEWKVAGKQPMALAYGVSVTQGDSVVCVGGSDAARHYSDAYRLEWKDHTLVTVQLPSLPMALANTCGALVGETLYLAGGQESPEAGVTSKAAWRIDLSSRAPAWERIDDCPGSGRMLAVATSFDGAFWMMGGVDLVRNSSGQSERCYLKDAYRYDEGKGWSRVVDLPRPVVGAPSPAPADARGFYVFGGDDGSQVGTPPDQHVGFSKHILCYDKHAANWVEVGESPAPRVTVPLVVWNGAWVVVSGEARPGVRSPEVWTFEPHR